MSPQTGGGNLRDSLRTQLWPVPLAATLAAVLLGHFVPYLDRQLQDQLPGVLSGLLFGGGPEAAQAVMQTIAGSLITVTSLTFSLTVVTLQLASSQFSPRLLRTFSRDTFVHNTLALFLATFVFALTVLRSIRAETSEGEGFVPKIAVTVGFGLTLASVIALVFFLAHLATQIRVETMMRDVHDEADETIDRIFPRDEDARAVDLAGSGPGAVLIESAVSGFLLGIDATAACAAAVKADAFVVIDAVPGHSLISGVPFARAWATDGRALDGQRLIDLSDGLTGSLSKGFERTSTWDAGYGLQQLLDVASRALSPGINDPTTAVHALGHISAVLCTLATRQTGPKLYVDERARPRVILNYPTFENLVDQVMRQMVRYALDDPRTAERAVRMLRELSWVVGPGPDGVAIQDRVAAVRVALATAELSADEKRRLLRECDSVAEACTGSWSMP
ncbi:DUF2254 domain-containing protein [Cryobacterium sinapicolor]|uniref:DUF2254 domain-containing protein n=1 Tax=Cryobacterium sinapicolor TaxID=1259236 RepID=A0ABY2JI44_9MICO|nr:DUF2254 domain-containing protein [Cryobacterium sinapicolor]TFD06331.1 DUF2254 domain-containing protein [Cryobacterium sinapicolor]